MSPAKSRGCSPSTRRRSDRAGPRRTAGRGHPPGHRRTRSAPLALAVADRTSPNDSSYNWTHDPLSGTAIGTGHRPRHRPNCVRGEGIGLAGCRDVADSGGRRRRRRPAVRRPVACSTGSIDVGGAVTVVEDGSSTTGAATSVVSVGGSVVDGTDSTIVVVGGASTVVGGTSVDGTTTSVVVVRGFRCRLGPVGRIRRCSRRHPCDRKCREHYPDD